MTEKEAFSENPSGTDTGKTRWQHARAKTQDGLSVLKYYRNLLAFCALSQMEEEPENKCLDQSFSLLLQAWL